MKTSARIFFKECWTTLRRLTGDDAYERYVAHHNQHHAGDVAMNRTEFFRSEQKRKWEGVRRCC